MPTMNPIVNINGTSRAELISQRTEIMDRLLDTMKAMQQSMPHGRDYLNDTGRMRADRETWNRRFNTLDAMRRDIMVEALALNNGAYKGTM